MLAIESQFRAFMATREACCRLLHRRLLRDNARVAGSESKGEEKDEECTAHEASEAADEGIAGAQEWIQLCDDNGHPYYHNVVTGESSWTPPEGVLSDDPLWHTAEAFVGASLSEQVVLPVVSR